MIIERDIEVGVDVQDPINLYSSDSIEYFIKSKYEKKCFKGCYIITVNKILLQSDCVINQESNDGSGTINVLFRATVLVYSEGEILTGCVVRRIDKKSGIVICETPIAYVMLKRTNIFESLKLEQKISVIVGKTRYAPGSDKIAVNGIPFLPAHIAIGYQVEEAVADVAEFTAEIRKLIAEEEEKCKQLKEKKQWKVFAGWIDANKTAPKHKTVSVFDLGIGVSSVGSTVSRGSNVIITQPVVCIDGKVKYDTVRSLPENEVVSIMLHDYYFVIKMLREMMEIYNTPGILKSHSNIWTIYNSRKID